MIKPRICKTYSGTKWVCFGYKILAYGKTPKEAYGRWFKRLIRSTATNDRLA